MKKIALTLLLGFALPAFADRMPLPANTPASFKNECSSCHLAYPPALLTAPDWQRTMAGLKDHFGTDASVDATAHAEITAFLERNAGNKSNAGGAGEILERPAHQIRRQLRSLPHQCRPGQLQRT